MAFPGYQTYSWLEQEGDLMVDRRARERRHRRRANQERRRRRAGEGPSARQRRPRTLVGYHVALQGKMDVIDVNEYYGYGVRGEEKMCSIPRGR
jgi:hypothetical protein